MTSQKGQPFELYTPSERARRDSSHWTLVQGILAPAQFLVFAVSLVLVVKALLTNVGVEAAQWSVIIKTVLLYSIMITGCLWEKEVFGRYLFAPSFFWEDVVSMGVMALHTLYLVLFFTGADATLQLWIALAAYISYLVNAAQFLYKFKLARRHAPATKLSGVAA